MRRYNKRRDTHPVSLFPFLAVLICTFGVLIVLLVLVVKAADHQADASKQEVQDRNASEKEELIAEVELQNIRVEGLQGIRPELLKKLQSARQHRAHLQSTIDSLIKDAEHIDAQHRLVANETEILIQAPSEDEIVRLRQQLESEMAELENRRRTASSNRPTTYSVVPHNGPDGTQRRPVYIECLADKLILQPYDIELSASHFVQPIVANNPLDAALIAVREYFLENKLNEAGQTPYPLLIVRPEGAEYYSIARHAIRSWDEEFGYELIAAEKQLNFGKPDPQLAKKMNLAVEASKKRQRAFVAEQILAGGPMHENGATGDGPSTGRGLQASSQLGGFVGPDGELATNRRPQANQGENDSAATRTGNPSTDQVGNESSIDGDGDGDGQSPMASIAESKGNNWALPDRNDRAIGYRRPVVVLLTQDEMIIHPNSSPATQRRIAFDEPLATSLEKLVTSVWQQVESWGVAGVNGYWKPELVFRLTPGEDQRFRQIVAMLQGSGLPVRKADE